MTEVFNSESEEFIIRDNEEKKSRLLFLLSFVISNKEYKSLAPVLKKVLVKCPTPAEFKAESKLINLFF